MFKGCVSIGKKADAFIHCNTVSPPQVCKDCWTDFYELKYPLNQMALSHISHAKKFHIAEAARSQMAITPEISQPRTKNEAIPKDRSQHLVHVFHSECSSLTTEAGVEVGVCVIPNQTLLPQSANTCTTETGSLASMWFHSKWQF